MFERLLGLLIAAVVVVLAGWIWQRWRERQLATISADDLATSVPTVLYFTAEWCGQCRLQQRPIIESLISAMRDCFQVQEVNVEAEPQLSERFGVVTLPTTVVVAPSGRIVARNAGVTPQTRLGAQIRAALPDVNEC